jgi:hypothetical protein
VSISREQTPRETRHVRTRVVGDNTYLDLIVNGESLTLPMNFGQERDTMIPEMAMPNSTLYTSAARPIGAILVSQDLDSCEVSVLGCFWRYGDYLITAKHNAVAIMAGVFQTFLAGTVKASNEKGYVLATNVLPVSNDLFDVDANAIAGDIDVFATKLMPGQWSRVGVGISRVDLNRTGSKYKQDVNAFGFVQRKLMTSVGKTEKDSGLTYVHHTATTNKGFSGSPVYSGNYVVAMHIAGQAQYNVAVRVEQIIMRLPPVTARLPPLPSEIVQESDFGNLTFNTREASWKYNGKKVRVTYDDEFGYHFEDDDGNVMLGIDEDRMRDEFPFHLSRYQQFLRDEAEPTQPPQFASTLANPRNYFNRPLGPAKPGEWGWDDEAARVSTIQNEVKQCVSNYFATRQPSARLECDARAEPKEALVQPAVAPKFTVLPSAPAVHCNATPKDDPIVSAYIDGCLTELKDLGFDPDLYAYPNITKASEAKSVELHLTLYADRLAKVAQPPTEQEMQRVAFLVGELCAENAFEPLVGYRSEECLLGVIDSSAVDSKKSPGQPFQELGLSTNEQVLLKYTKRGFVQLTLNEWESDVIQLKDFIKAEPHKRKKLDEGLLRVITGLPLNKMVQHQAMFIPMLDVAVKNMRKSPIKYGFAPGNPGNIEHLVQWLGEGKIYEADKPNWDYQMYPYYYDIVERVVLSLARRPHDMSEAEFAQYKVDVSRVFYEMKSCCVHRCTRGDMLKSLDGTMKSGWLLTIFVNSMAQLVCDTLIKVRMGLSNDVILSPSCRMVVGGDDTLQKFPDNFDLEAYYQQASLLGVVLEPFEIHKSFNGCSFFSTRFRYQEGVWAYFPMRFTKHIAKLRKTKVDDLPMALASHMYNYCWDNKRFTWFERMFKKFRKEQPELFALNLCKPQLSLKLASKGAELGFC